MPRVDLWLDEDDVRDAQTSGMFSFTVPEDAHVKGNIEDPRDEKAKATWTQTLEVVESKMYEDTTRDAGGNEYPSICMEVKFQVPSDALRQDGAADPNSGRSHTAWYRIVKAALKNKQHPKYKANNFNLSRANGMLRSIWGEAVIPHGAKVNLGDFFDGSPAPVVGKSVIATMKASRYDGNRRDELTDFVPLELRGN